MTSLIRPVVQSLLVADHVYTDSQSGKRVIAGVFQRLLFLRKTSSIEEVADHPQVKAGGFVSGSPFAYASLTDIVGEQRFELRYVDLETDRIIFGITFAIHAQDRLATTEVSFPLPPLPAGKAGFFALELIWSDEPIGLYRIQVSELSPTKNEAPGDNDSQ